MSNAGFFNVSTQSAKGTANAAGYGCEIYCTSIMPVVGDMTSARQPAVGGKAFTEDIYKAGTSVGAQASFEVPGKHIGYLLYYLSGAVAVSDDTGPVNGVQVGVDTYTFTMASGDDFTLPWFTTLVDTEDLLYTQMADCALLSMQLVFSAGASVQAQVALAGITPSFGAVAANSVQDTSPILVSSNADALFELDDAAVDANQVAIAFGNVAPQVTQEMKIGSPYRRDITKLARACRVTVRKWVDVTTYKAIYFGGSTAWSADPYTAKLEVRGASGSMIAGSEPYSLEFEAAEVGFGPAGVPQSGAQLTYMEMAGDVVVPSAGEEFTFILGSVADVDFTEVQAAP